MTAEQLADAAYRFHVLGHTQAQIARDLLPAGLRAGQGVISRWLKLAEEQRIIQHDIDADAGLAGIPIRADESRLGTLYPALATAFVFDLRKFTADYKESEWDSKRHIALANHAGELAHSTLARQPKKKAIHIAIAGGRTCARLARVLARAAPGTSEYLVTPLGGHIWSGRLWETGAKHAFEEPLNPDYAAVLLASGLNAAGRTKVRFSQIGRELFARDAAEAANIIAERCVFQPGGKWLDDETCDHAFVGVGCLAQSTHRYSEILRDGERSDNDRIMASIQENLKRETLPLPGDVANRFLLALPLPSELEGRDLDALERLYNDESDRLDHVNACSVVVEWGHLKGAGENWVIAGGGSKKHVLFTLLLYGETHPDRLVTRLVTDTETAQYLADAKERYDTSDPAVQRWYARLCSRLFRS